MPVAEIKPTSKSVGFAEKMADRITPRQRSKNMSRIRGRDTKPELALRTALYRLGLRYRVCVESLPGKPDIVFTKQRLALQVRGCFWHQHEGCPHCRRPSSNEAYWYPKLERNRQRDRANDHMLSEAGWRVVVFWECELKMPTEIQAAALKVAGMMRGPEAV